MRNLRRMWEQLGALYPPGSLCQIPRVLREAPRQGEGSLRAPTRPFHSSRVGSGLLLISNIDQATEVNVPSLAQ